MLERVLNLCGGNIDLAAFLHVHKAGRQQIYMLHTTKTLLVYLCLLEGIPNLRSGNTDLAAFRHVQGAGKTQNQWIMARFNPTSLTFVSTFDLSFPYTVD